MYEEEEKRGFPLRDLIVKLIVAVVFVLLLVWLLPKVDLTGLNNRNCYEWMIQTYPNMCKSSLSCIYIDVNGLHELNNTQGHKAGDDMLSYIAQVTQKYFGMQNAYRIGGDEFCVLLKSV